MSTSHARPRAGRSSAIRLNPKYAAAYTNVASPGERLPGAGSGLLMGIAALN